MEDRGELTWTIEAEGDRTKVSFSGEIDHRSDLASLRDKLRGHVVFDFGELRRLNSSGVREWINFIRDLPAITTLEFQRCSQDFVRQLNMIFNFRGHATVASFFAPYACADCHAEVERLLDVARDFPDRNIDVAPAFPCDACGGTLELDELPDRYLHFLTRLPPATGP